ncbi:hypothetical protein OS493_033201 [Desmophyllum pertusum]|uniref:Uncharacterized protein n=1 Tax=Desmophyllum pertusum TaxID=174260 RepID=A0A9W9YBD1_9CNID|nr:hypothetical protein OS493_033201 [Desmophyllum pertusum]
MVRTRVQEKTFRSVLRDNVLSEVSIQHCHPVIYDSYNICELVLNSVSMLRRLDTLEITVRRKKPLVELLSNMTKRNNRTYESWEKEEDYNPGVPCLPVGGFKYEETKPDVIHVDLTISPDKNEVVVLTASSLHKKDKKSFSKKRTEGSSKSESDTPDDDSRKQRKIAAEHWDDVEKEDVDKLPRELMALDCSS